MARYIVLASWTEQGIKNIKESPARLDAAREIAKKCGCTLGDFYMTAGATDMCLIVDAPDDASLAKFSLSVARGGSVRTTTMRAFTETEYRSVIGSL
jgi:uncharacterized protein with GYD domain